MNFTPQDFSASIYLLKKIFYKGKENDTKSGFLLCKAEFKLFFNLEAYLSSNLNNLLFIHISCKEKKCHF